MKTVSCWNLCKPRAGKTVFTGLIRSSSYGGCYFKEELVCIAQYKLDHFWSNIIEPKNKFEIKDVFPFHIKTLTLKIFHKRFHLSMQCIRSNLLHGAPANKQQQQKIVNLADLPENWMKNWFRAVLNRFEASNYLKMPFLPDKGSPLWPMLVESHCWQRKTEHLQDVSRFVYELRNRIFLLLNGWIRWYQILFLIQITDSCFWCLLNNHL